VVIWRLDRLGRSLRELVDLVEHLRDAGVGLRSLSEAIDTTTATGRLQLHLFATLAEFERELIRERTTAGLAAAAARGRRGGRPTVMTPVKASAAALEVGKTTVHRHLAAAAVDTPT
jgi:DNA invertase Pin-like site-specific DNA recombinase